jgi:hypothetical protein
VHDDSDSDRLPFGTVGLQRSGYPRDRYTFGQRLVAAACLGRVEADMRARTHCRIIAHGERIRGPEGSERLESALRRVGVPEN